MYAEIAAGLKGDRPDAATGGNVSGGQGAEDWPKDSAGEIALRLPRLLVYGERLGRNPKVCARSCRWGADARFRAGAVV